MEEGLASFYGVPHPPLGWLRNRGISALAEVGCHLHMHFDRRAH